MSNPILNAEDFRRGVASFASQIELMERVFLQFNADIDGIREFGREFERNDDVLCVTLSDRALIPPARLSKHSFAASSSHDSTGSGRTWTACTTSAWSSRSARYTTMRACAWRWRSCGPRSQPQHEASAHRNSDDRDVPVHWSPHGAARAAAASPHNRCGKGGDRAARKPYVHDQLPSDGPRDRSRFARDARHGATENPASDRGRRYAAVR